MFISSYHPALFYDSKGNQGTIHSFEAIRWSYWRPKLQQDIVSYVGKCTICTKHMPNMAKYPQQHLEVLKIPMAVLAMDTIGHLPITSKGNRQALTAICLHTSDVFIIPMKEKFAANVVQAYLSGILAHKGGSVAILSNNGTEFKNKMLNKVCHQLGIKSYLLTHFTLKVMQRWKTPTICLKDPHQVLRQQQF